MGKYTYYVYSAETDLPVLIADTLSEVASFIGVALITVFRNCNTDNDMNGFKVLSWRNDDLLDLE